MSSSFSYKLTTENEQFTFDYSQVIATGETILTTPGSQPVCTVEVKEGTDSNPTAILPGGSTSGVVSGTKVAIRVYNGLDGVIYRLAMTVTTDLGNVYTIVGDLPVLSPMNV
jgi:hypothetical protein